MSLVEREMFILMSSIHRYNSSYEDAYERRDRGTEVSVWRDAEGSWVCDYLPP
jgi:hypothetical protein